MTTTATAAQIAFITRLREDKAWRMDLPELDPTVARDADHLAAIRQTEAAGRAAFEASLDGITKAQASEMIDALKAW